MVEEIRGGWYSVFPRVGTNVFRRGRNANVHTIPHSADRAQYQKATALEALFGWLYLQGRHERINGLFNRMMEAHDAACRDLPAGFDK